MNVFGGNFKDVTLVRGSKFGELEARGAKYKQYASTTTLLFLNCSNIGGGLTLSILSLP